MSLKLGSGAINKSYLGSTQINKSYLGDTVIFGGAVEGEVYVNDFSTLDGLTLVETAGTVTSESPIGTVLPNTPKALTLNHSSAGNVYASIDLGVAYTETLYVQFYFSVTKSAGATSYTDCFQIGNTVNTNETCEFKPNHAQPTGYRMYGIPSYQQTGVYNKDGQWHKFGMKIDRVALTCDYYYDGVLAGQKTINARDMQYITMGGTGDNVIGYKQQFASLTINTLGFQDNITSPNGVGEYSSMFIDYSLIDSAEDTSGWSGVHSEPFDPDGGTNYVDGPAIYLSDVGVNYAYTTENSAFCFKRGVTHKMEDTSIRGYINKSAGVYNATQFPKADAYGTGSLPIVDISAIVDPSSWVVHDAPNSIYKTTLTTTANFSGAFINNGELALRRDVNGTRIATTSGVVAVSGNDVLVRMYDDSDPSLTDVAISSSLSFQISNYGTVNNIHFRHGLAQTGQYGLIQNCEFTIGSGCDVNALSIFRDNYMHDLWAGTDYGDTEATNTGFGLAGSGRGSTPSVRVYADSKVYRNKVYDAYQPIQIFPESEGAIISYNEFRNTIVNTISFSGGSVNGNPLKPIIVSNNTVFSSPRAKQNDPYPLVRDQPGHGFVHQLGSGAVFKYFNNLMLLHYTEIISANSVMNLNSQINVLAIGELGYNKYYMTPISEAPAEIFNQGAIQNDVASWGTALASYGDFKDMDGIANPDSTSSVASVLPVTQADATLTSGKWLTIVPTPISTGGGFDYDYASLEITTDLSGSPITSTKNIGAY